MLSEDGSAGRHRRQARSSQRCPSTWPTLRAVTRSPNTRARERLAPGGHQPLQAAEWRGTTRPPPAQAPFWPQRPGHHRGDRGRRPCLHAVPPAPAGRSDGRRRCHPLRLCPSSAPCSRPLRRDSSSPRRPSLAAEQPWRASLPPAVRGATHQAASMGRGRRGRRANTGKNGAPRAQQRGWGGQERPAYVLTALPSKPSVTAAWPARQGEKGGERPAPRPYPTSPGHNPCSGLPPPPPLRPPFTASSRAQ